jgi:hypothetical protein
LLFLKCYYAVPKKCYFSLYGISKWSCLVKNVSLMTFLMFHTSCTNEWWQRWWTKEKDTQCWYRPHIGNQYDFVMFINDAQSWRNDALHCGQHSTISHDKHISTSAVLHTINDNVERKSKCCGMFLIDLQIRKESDL